MGTKGQTGPSEILAGKPGFANWLLEGLTDGIVACDADGRLIMLNQTAREWFGGDFTGILIDEWTDSHNLYNSDGITPLTASEAPLARALQGEQLTDERVAIAAPGKPLRFISVSGGPVVDSRGGKSGAAVVMRDVSKQPRDTQRLPELEDANRKLQAALEEVQRENKKAGRERALLRCILDSANDLIFFKDQDSVYRGCNLASEQFLGLSEREQIGKTDSDFFGPEAAAIIHAADRKVMESGKPLRLEEWVTYPDGRKALMDTMKVPYRGPDGELLGLVGIARDITELLRTQDALRESEAKYMDLYENAPDMYVSVNAKTGLIEQCNRTLADTLGYAKEEIIGRPVFDIYHPDCLPEVKETFYSFVKTGSVYDKELLLKKKDGLKLDVSLNVTTLCDEEGQIITSRSTLRDITERKRSNEVNAARMRLLQFAVTRSLDELLEETLNEAERITSSLIGFYHLVGNDQNFLILQNWSSGTKAKYCQAEGKGVHYPISDAGVWADCIHQRKPVIHNDLATLAHRKGLPAGHPEVIRELVVPVFRGNSLKALLGVGNKPTEYTEKDIDSVSLLADLVWEIAERKRAEEKILRSDQRLRFHSEQSPLGFLEWDEKFHAVEWNAACERIFGYTRQEAIGRSAKDLILPAEVHELVDGIYHSLMAQSGGQHSINTNVTKDGRLITCEWYNTTLIDKNGKAIGVASICRDITEQQRMEEELSRYREQLEEQVKERTAELEIARNKAQQYLDIAGVILVAIDESRRVTLINQKGCEVLGAAARDIVGKDWFENFIPANIRRKVIRSFQMLMAGELEPVSYFENSILAMDGRQKLVAWHNAVLRDDRGAVIGTLSSGEDITEKKHAEKMITNLNRNLLNRTSALEAANKELEAFAYSVSHDLRAPLRHIDGFIDLLQKKAGAVLDDQSRHYMETISNAANKMGHLIDDLLAFSRTGRQVMTYRQVALEQLAHDVIQELGAEAASRTIEWQIGHLPTVNGDVSMLRIVLSNLISNALKFTRPRRQARIEIGTLTGQDSEVAIFVRDNGVGFDMTYADRLFGVFQRLHSADEFEGTGIGLANVGRIVARHGGRTWARGQPDQGAIFCFTLPVSRQGEGR